MSRKVSHAAGGGDLYALYDELDRLEELLEDMAALGVESAAQAQARITDLDVAIQTLEADRDPGQNDS